MGLYERHILPRIIDFACGMKAIARQRGKVVPAASGRVLEVGMGSGLNLPFYDPARVEMVWGLEPSEGMRARARKRLAASPMDVRWLDLPGEEIPLDDESVDTVVLTFTLCTIGPWEAALAQMRRVLKPGGRLLFCEHGKAPDLSVLRWQQRLNPGWKKLAGGCNLDRPIPSFLERGGFVVDELNTGYLPGPRFATFNYRGVARTARRRE